MRTVFDNDMVAHVWANRSQPHGQSHNGNFSFDGSLLYSYRTCIARFVNDDKATKRAGAPIVLVTSERYSVTTTSKHMAPMWRALHGHPYKVFTVPHIITAWGSSPLLSEAQNAANLAYLVKQYVDRCATYIRAQSLYRDESGIREDLEELAAQVTDYARAFGLRIRKAQTLNPAADAADIMRKRAEREARYNAPGMAEKRERDRARREERKAEKERQAREEAFKRDAESRATWLAGGAVWGWRGSDETGGALLRVKDDTLETSHGARVPLAHAVKAFRFLKLIRERGQAWERNGHTVRVGHFQIDRIEPDGSFRAGCHRIHWPEVERIARQIGVYDETASEAAAEPSQVAA